MATNHLNWMTAIKNKILERQLNTDGSNKNHEFKPKAYSMSFSGASVSSRSMSFSRDKVDDAGEDAAADSDVSSVSDVRPADLCLYDTPYSTDMNFSDMDTDPSVSDDESVWNTVLDDNRSLSSLDEEDEFNSTVNSIVTVSSTETTLNHNNQSDNKCAVVLCNEHFRKQFSALYFVRFPTDNLSLCDVWWERCGRSGDFDPSAKICSIHFNSTDFKTSTITRNNQLFRQTAVNTYCTVPTKFLLPQDFAIFSSKKRKKNIGENNKTKMNKCSVENCNKTNLKNSKSTLFFRFPLKNKLLLKKWLNSVNLSNWQPSETDEICSDHFENHDIIKLDSNYYKLEKYAYPSIKPKKPFVLSSEDNNKISTNFEFDQVDDYSKKIENKKVKVRNIVSTNNVYKNSQLQNEASTIKLNFTGNNFNEEKQLLNTPANFNDSIVECSLIDSILDRNSNTEELQPISKCAENSLKQYLESFESQIAKDELCKQNRVEFPPVRILSFENKPSGVHSSKSCSTITTSNPSPKLLMKKASETKLVEGIPKSILNNNDLIESYGELLLPTCEIGCEKFCFHAVPGPQRRFIFKEFQMLDDANEQNCKIAQLIQLRMVKKADNTFESCPSFHLIVNDGSVKVCRLFFSNTLGITDSRLNAILNPINYSWYTDRETALKVRHPHALHKISEPVTDFMKQSLPRLKHDYNLFEPESDSEVSLDNVSPKEYRKALLFMKSIPRVLSSHKAEKNSGGTKFETSICFDHIYKTYSENSIKSNTPPPYTKRQFKKIYNHYMKTFLKTI